jgi:hypothetical protein
MKSQTWEILNAHHFLHSPPPPRAKKKKKKNEKEIYFDLRIWKDWDWTVIADLRGDSNPALLNLSLDLEHKRN